MRYFLTCCFLTVICFAALSQTIPADSARFSLAQFYTYQPALEHRVDQLFDSLTDEQRAGQLIVQAAGKLGKPTETIIRLVREQKLGGVLLLGGSKSGFTQLTAQLDKITQETGGLPLLYSADAEPSLMNRKIAETQKVKNTSAIRSQEECAAVARLISGELLAMGIRQNFAPVSDLSPGNQAIGNRSFGSNRDTVVWMNSIFIETTQQAGIIATAKHFPGHGYVQGDTHRQLVYIDGEMREVDTYKPLIAGGVLSVMVGHIAVRNNDYDTKGLPASCSRRIVTDLLKNELGFRGLVVTDALNMGALDNISQASFKAIQAGADMALMPRNENELYAAILKEMGQKEDFRNQVYTSVKKIIRLKLCLELLD